MTPWLHFLGIVTLLLISRLPLNCAIEIEFLGSILSTLNLTHPFIICPQDELNVLQAKHVFKGKQYARINNDFSKANLANIVKIDMIAILHDANEFLDLHKTVMKAISTLVLVIHEKIFSLVYNEMTIPLDKKVYFIKQSTKEVFESYQVNDHKVQKKLGRFFQNKFIWDKSIIEDFLERRSDFGGQNLKVMVAESGNALSIDMSYITKALYFQNNKTFLVSNFTSGIYKDILQNMQSQLNFTTEFYKQKVEAWGSVYQLSNGSYTATGMVGDLVDKRVDLVPVLGISLQRSVGIDYLLPLTPWKIGLYINSDNSEEIFHFGLLLAPFRL